MQCYHVVYAFLMICSNQETEGHLPDVMWCREPFFEELRGIEALNDINN